MSKSTCMVDKYRKCTYYIVLITLANCTVFVNSRDILPASSRHTHEHPYCTEFAMNHRPSVTRKSAVNLAFVYYLTYYQITKSLHCCHGDILYRLYLNHNSPRQRLYCRTERQDRADVSATTETYSKRPTCTLFVPRSLLPIKTTKHLVLVDFLVVHICQNELTFSTPSVRRYGGTAIFPFSSSKFSPTNNFYSNQCHSTFCYCFCCCITSDLWS